MQIQDISAFDFDFEMQMDNRTQIKRSSCCAAAAEHGPFQKETGMQAPANSHRPLRREIGSNSMAFSPICQVVVVIIRQTLPKEVAVTQVTGLEVIGVQAFNELDARRAAEVASRWHCVGCVLCRGLAALVSPSGGRGIAGLKARARLAVAPGERRRAVGEAGHAASVGLITIVAHVAAVQTAGEKRGRGPRHVENLSVNVNVKRNERGRRRRFYVPVRLIRRGPQWQ